MKCSCNVCSVKLEFDESQLGQRLNCPSCGGETVLYHPAVPIPEASEGRTLGQRFKPAGDAIDKLLAVFGKSIGLALMVFVILIGLYLVALSVLFAIQESQNAAYAAACFWILLYCAHLLGKSWREARRMNDLMREIRNQNAASQLERIEK